VYRGKVASSDELRADRNVYANFRVDDDASSEMARFERRALVLVYEND